MKNMRGKTLIYLQTRRGVHMTGSILQDKQHVPHFRKIEQSGQYHVITQKIKKPIRKAISSMKIQPHFSQAADRPDPATSTRLVVSLQPVSNVILGRRITCSTTVLSLVTDNSSKFQSSGPLFISHNYWDSALLKILYWWTQNIYTVSTVLADEASFHGGLVSNHQCLSMCTKFSVFGNSFPHTFIICNSTYPKLCYTTLS